MIEIDYFLFGIVALSLVAVFGIWSFNRREIAIKRLEEDRKDARQDIAKEQTKQLKQMQYQHELDLQRLELQIQSGQDGMADLVKSVLPIFLNKQNVVSESVSETEETAGGITQGLISAESDVSEACSSSDSEEQIVRECLTENNAAPVTEFRRFVDSEAGDAFFQKYKNVLLKK